MKISFRGKGGRFNEAAPAAFDTSWPLRRDFLDDRFSDGWLETRIQSDSICF